MKGILKWTGLLLLAATLGLGMAVAFAAGVRAQSPAAVVQAAVARATPLPYGDWESSGYLGGVGRGGWRNGYDGGWGMGPGMTPALAPGASVGGFGGSGMMGSWMHGGATGGYGGWGYGYDAAPGGTPAPVDEEIQLAALDFRFDPPAIAVEAGETVRLVVANRDGLPHNLYGPALLIAYTPLPAGVTRSVTFTAPEVAGTYSAICTFHPGMSLEVVVE